MDRIGPIAGSLKRCRVEHEEKVVAVCDNLNTHTKDAFYEAFPAECARRLVCRLDFCDTPRHGRWLNMAENERSSVTRECVAGR